MGVRGRRGARGGRAARGSHRAGARRARGVPGSRAERSKRASTPAPPWPRAAPGYTRAVSLLVAGPWGSTLLLFFALGVPLQLAIGALIGMRRAVPAIAALVFPLLFALGGLAVTVAALEAGMAALWNASDPSWAPWFALEDRARAMLPAALAGFGAAALVAPVALGAAVAGARGGATRGRWAFTLVVAALGLVGVGGAGLLAAGLSGGGVLLPAIGGAALFVAACLAAAPGAARHVPVVVIGYGALAIGAPGLALGAWAWAAAGVAAPLGDYSAAFAAMDAVVAAARAAGGVGRAGAGLALAFLALGALPALARDWRRVDPGAGLEAFATVGLAGLVLLLAGWAGARERALATLAGAHAAEVLQHAPGYDVPRREPIPTRVLVGEAATPRWLMMRPRGGVERLPIAGGLDIVGPAVLLGDGLMLPASLPLEDLYLGLFQSGAGSVALVGCGPADDALKADIRRDPLLAVGRCGAFPIALRVTSRLVDPRVLIVLKDGLVDDRGDVIPRAEVPDLDGRTVILRGQIDATVGDLVAMLPLLGGAEKVYLGHGVTLEGDDLPIGVDPGLRITKLPQERVAEAAAAEPAAAEPAAAE